MAKRGRKAEEKKPRASLRAVPQECTLGDAVSGGYGDLEALRDECQEVYDNSSEGLQQSQRVQTMEETAQALDGAASPPDVPADLEGLAVRYTEDRRKSRSTSRATRCGDACNLLAAAVEAIGAWVAEQPEEDKRSEHQRDLVQEAEELRDSIEEMVGSAEGCEFPGMYG